MPTIDKYFIYLYDTKDPSFPLFDKLPSPGWIPYNGTNAMPPSDIPNGMIPCFDPDKKDWVLFRDFRKVDLWDIKTKEKVISTTVKAPEGVVDVAPETQWDVWNGTRWVLDEKAKYEYDLNELQKEKNRLVNLAKDQIEQITDIIAEIGEEEPWVSALKEWKSFRVKINLIKVTNLDVKFPQRPETIEEFYG